MPVKYILNKWTNPGESYYPISLNKLPQNPLLYSNGIKLTPQVKLFLANLPHSYLYQQFDSTIQALLLAEFPCALPNFQMKLRNILIPKLFIKSPHYASYLGVLSMPILDSPLLPIE